MYTHVESVWIQFFRPVYFDPLVLNYITSMSRIPQDSVSRQTVLQVFDFHELLMQAVKNIQNLTSVANINCITRNALVSCINNWNMFPLEIFFIHFTLVHQDFFWNWCRRFKERSLKHSCIIKEFWSKNGNWTRLDIWMKHYINPKISLHKNFLVVTSVAIFHIVNSLGGQMVKTYFAIFVFRGLLLPVLP